jgi:hypothetical protein
MSIYTVHEPPLWAGAAAPDPDRYVFVRDGFLFWAFLFGPLWALRHRMWLVLLLYIAASIVLGTFLGVAGASAFVVGVIVFLIALLTGLEAGTLRRFTLRRRGWKYVAVVSGEDREAAERRFFDTWLSSGTPPSAPHTIVWAAPKSQQPHSPTHSPDVIGLFPEPGASR